MPKTHSITLGATEVTFAWHGPAQVPPSTLLLRLHGDEHTASAVGIWASRHDTRPFLDIVHEQRLVAIAWQGRAYYFDPNRMFSLAGIQQSLRAHAKSPPDAVVAYVQQLSDFYLSLIQPYSTLIALHNNHDFSVQSYLPGGECAHSAVAVQAFPENHLHDFIIVTQAADFAALAKAKINVVQEKYAENDQPGSLSEYCLARNIRYFNIETRHGGSAIQRALLRAVLACSS